MYVLYVMIIIAVMQLWDSLKLTNSPVLVIGATNRPQDLDSAVQRRFERSFHVGVPNEAGRIEIFQKLLSKTKKTKHFDFTVCARWTEGYTASDLENVCRAAMSIPLKEQYTAMRNINKDMIGSIASNNISSAAQRKQLKPRPLTISVILSFMHCC